MSEFTCAETLDRLAELVGGDLPEEDRRAVESHVATCEDCREEHTFLQALRSARPEPAPADLQATRDAVRVAMTPPMSEASSSPLGDPRRARETRSRWRSRWRELRWSIPAAAVLILALGTSSVWTEWLGSNGGEAHTEFVEFGEDALAGFYGGEDGLVAGAPVFEDLPDEVLLTLLEEMNP